MEKHIVHHIFLSLILLLQTALPSHSASSGIFTPEVCALLDSLDAELSRCEERQNEYLSHIGQLRKHLDRTSGNEARYWAAHEIFEAYRNFDSDSALAYAAVCYDLASKLGRQDWMDEMNMNRTYIYSATGLLQDAQESLAAVDSGRLEGKALIDYYIVRIFMETHLDQYLGRNAVRVYQPETDKFLTNLCSSIPDDDPDYFWIMGWHSIADSARASCMRPKLESVLAGSGYNTLSDAKDAWMLSRLCEQVGDSVSKMRYLTLSALADTRTCNREIASLEELGAILLNHGELERANMYLSHSIRCANSYKSRVRVGELSQLQDKVFKVLNDFNMEQLRKTRRYMVLVLLVSLVLVVALVFIGFQLHRQRKIRRVLSDTKESLLEHVGELQTARNDLQRANEKLSELYETARRSSNELAEVNDAKEKYIANLFSICSSYINKMDDFRKNIFRMLMAKRFDEVFELMKSPDLSHGEIKELYSNFDSIFLKIYPDFVRDFNSLLRPEEQIVLKKGELLNTELRIYALVRLGMTDSVSIAQFLHCSVQTVYNTRQRARNKAAVPRDTFADCVRQLGKPSI